MKGANRSLRAGQIREGNKSVIVVAGKTLDSADDMGLQAEEEAILRERLSGLGYI